MTIDNGARRTLEIDGVFSGIAGVAGGFVSFVPNLRSRSAAQATRGVLGGVEVRLAPKKDEEGPFWTSRFEVIE